MDRLPNKRSLNLRNGRIDGNIVDTGGYSFYYLRDNPVRCLSLGLHTDYGKFLKGNLEEDLKQLIQQGFTRQEVNWLKKFPDTEVEFFYQGHFVHLKCGRDNVQSKIEALNELLNEVINE